MKTALIVIGGPSMPGRPQPKPRRPSDAAS